MKSNTSFSHSTASILMLLIGMIGFIGCDSGGSGGGNSGPGSSTIMGTVASFSGGSAFFVPEKSARGLHTFLAGLSDLLIPPASAAVKGVSVNLMGTDLGSTTAPDGLFVISGVAAGQAELLFTLGDQSAILVVDIPEGTTIELRDIVIANGVVTVGQVLKVESETVSNGSASSDVGGGLPGSGDDFSDDDDSQDGDSHDDDSSGDEDSVDDDSNG